MSTQETLVVVTALMLLAAANVLLWVDTWRRDRFHMDAYHSLNDRLRLMPIQFTAPIGANAKLAEDQPEYETIPIRRDLIFYDMQNGLGPTPINRCVVAVDLTPSDLERLYAGEKLHISVLGVRFAPMLVTVGDPNAEQPPINLD